jgi:peptidoglycan hydrolase-like protein with peptidoglycan-binding domain
MKAWVRVSEVAVHVLAKGGPTIERRQSCSLWRYFRRRILPASAFAVIFLVANSALALMQLGDTGSQVETLQRRLQELGYFDGPITGYYGELTADAVQEFQRSNGLSVDGIVGSQTESALQLPSSSDFSQSRSTLPPVPTTQNQATAPDSEFARNNQRFPQTNRSSEFARNNQRFPQTNRSQDFPIQRGDIGDRIVQLQQQLQTLGYYDGFINGIFDARVEEAVEAFQQDKNLSDTGKVNSETQTALNRAQQQTQFSSGGRQQTTNAERTILRRGDSSPQVLKVQKRLHELGYYNGRLSGHFGPKTEAAVIKFQQDRGFIGNGIVDAATRNAMGLLLPASAEDFPAAEETPNNSDFQIVPIPEN